MRILHISRLNIAGIPYELMKSQNQIGDYSRLVTLSDTYLNYPKDIFLHEPQNIGVFGYQSIKAFLKKISYMLRYNLLNFDIYHLHNGEFYIFQLYRLLKTLGKKIIVHYHGSKLRTKGEIQYLKKYSDLNLVSTPDLLNHIENAEWLPNPIDMAKYKPINKLSNSIVISHAPTNRTLKGTDYIIKIIKKLQKDFDITFHLIENLPHNQCLNLIKQSDIVIDQILTGYYSLVSIEGLTFNSVVFVNIEKVLDYIPKHPFINVNQTNLEEKLRQFLTNTTLLNQKRKNGRNWLSIIPRGAKWLKFT